MLLLKCLPVHRSQDSCPPPPSGQGLSHICTLKNANPQYLRPQGPYILEEEELNLLIGAIEKNNVVKLNREYRSREAVFLRRVINKQFSD